MESDTNLIPLLEEIRRLMHKCRSCQQVAALPRQTSHTLQMRKVWFHFKLMQSPEKKYLLDGGGNFVADGDCGVEGWCDLIWVFWWIVKSNSIKKSESSKPSPSHTVKRGIGTAKVLTLWLRTSDLPSWQALNWRFAGISMSRLWG